MGPRRRSERRGTAPSPCPTPRSSLVTHHSLLDLVDHGHLLAALERIVGARVAPPVEAALRVGRVHVAVRRLRVDDHDVVGLRPLVVASVASICVLHIALALAAPVELDMKAAGRVLLARSGHVDVALVVHADGRRGAELGLVELHQVGVHHGAPATSQGAVHGLQRHPSAIVVAVVDVGRAQRGARVAVVRGGHAMLAVDGELARHVAAGDHLLVQLLRHLDHR
mmetsp:Transcript_22243/g.71579  ORF Transcript_22243/g.71579 Transcript_22243/m.71579 type:complete len:225 (+) Transcript_22243:374-1048(+)